MSFKPTLRVLIVCIFGVVSHVQNVLADCECGFRDEENRIWMDGLVLPFEKIKNLENNNDVWLNDYVHSKGHGNYTYSVSPDNVYVENGELVLKVTPPSKGTIGSSQLSTRRKDLFYGTYRSEIYMPPQVGSCVGFFHYHNDSEEIDIEYIGQNKDMLYLSTKRTNPGDYSTDIDYLNYVEKKDTLQVFHDYRFDWVQDKVDFYVNNRKVYTASSAIPSTPARAMLMNWGNGDLDWSSVPKENIYARFKNMRVFFNSTHPYVVNNYRAACKAAQTAQIEEAICDISTFSKTLMYGYNENVIRKYAISQSVSKGLPNSDQSRNKHMSSNSSSRKTQQSYGIFSLLYTIILATFFIVIM